VQVIFQDPYEVYNPFYTIDHVLETPVTKYRLAGSRAAGQALIEETLQAVGLRPEETLGRFPHQLSGGQRQRVMVARALLVKPRLIIADEPVSMVDASLRATILDSLRRLTRERNVSVVYITHDLTTAYQIAENIIVLYRGAVSEVGDVRLVVKQPCHPYTQLLVSSIPRPDPEHTWEMEQGVSEVGRQADTSVACRFADRCPHAMPICLEKPPPLFQTEPHRAAACYLYQTATALPGAETGRVFVAPSGVTHDV
jgi:peptide/nickel transport system ATP-binding protein